jgi:hypothetical protein
VPRTRGALFRKALQGASAALGLLLLASALSCRAPRSGSGSGSGAPEPSGALLADAAVADAGILDANAPDASTLPVVERACTRDDECAVARVSVQGPSACCAACATTPGTRRWHAALQLYCGAHPSTACGPLACPEGPTRAVCRAGRCEATWTGADGGPARVGVERRCLPALSCDAWVGCALVEGNAQDGWFVEEAAQATRGAVAAVGNVCTAGPVRCEAARITEPGVVCPPWSIPPVITAPAYTCSLEGGRCQSSAAR